MDYDIWEHQSRRADDRQDICESGLQSHPNRCFPVETLATEDRAPSSVPTSWSNP